MSSPYGSAHHRECGFQQKSPGRHCHSSHHQPHPDTSNFHHLSISMSFIRCCRFPMICSAAMAFSPIQHKFENKLLEYSNFDSVTLIHRNGR